MTHKWQLYIYWPIESKRKQDSYIIGCYVVVVGFLGDYDTIISLLYMDVLCVNILCEWNWNYLAVPCIILLLVKNLASNAALVSKAAGLCVLVSHWSGELEDNFIDDLSVGLASGQVLSSWTP